MPSSRRRSSTYREAVPDVSFDPDATGTSSLSVLERFPLGIVSDSEIASKSSCYACRA